MRSGVWIIKIMQLNKQIIDEYIKIMREEYGRKLSKKEASDEIHKLTNYYNLLLEIKNKYAKRK